MELSSFSSLLEVGATLNIACVAVEYVKSYTSVLCNQVFNLAVSIKDVVKQCQQKLNEVMDETTLANLPDELSGGKSIVTLKRSLVKCRDSLNNEIVGSEKALKSNIEKVCEVKSVSSISLWLFLYGISALFLIGFESCQHERNIRIHLFWSVLTLFGCIFSVVGWISDGEHRPWWKFGYCSLRFAILSFAISVLVCIVAISFLSEWLVCATESAWMIILVVVHHGIIKEVAYNR